VGNDRAGAGARPSRTSPRNAQPLSAREQQVLRLLALGYTNKQIADDLLIGVKSIETYRSRLSKKLGLRTRADFVRYALDSGLLTSKKAAQ
jgi:DNA-binding NarL/FixJ family response regulator